MRGGAGSSLCNRENGNTDSSAKSARGDSNSKLRLKYGLSCVLLNAQSIRSKFAELECLTSVEKPDIVCITETWVSEQFNGDRIQDFELEGYNLFSHSRQTRQGGGSLYM